jgi:DNA-damage-inducible protein J
MKRGLVMAKTIQVRVDDELKESADMLFASLGLDTSTAIRMFLVAAKESGGIPFAIMHRADRDTAILEAIERRKSSGAFLTAEQSLANMRTAIKAGAEHGS